MGKWTVVWDGGSCIAEPTWNEITGVLSMIDGVTRTSVALELSDYGVMTIGGGSGGKFIVIFTFDDPDRLPYTLVEESVTGPDVELVIEGVASEYPARLCVTRQQAIEAFRRFFQAERFVATAEWEEG